MRIRAVVATIWLVLVQLFFGMIQSHAAGLLWEVENPYRFFKKTSSFEVQERAFDAVRGTPSQPLPW